MSIDAIQSQMVSPTILLGDTSSSLAISKTPSPESVEKFNAIYNADSVAGAAPIADASAVQSSSPIDAVIANLNSNAAMSPSALLEAQGQLMSIQINWIITSQVAGKIGSGIQTVLNNQV